VATLFKQCARVWVVFYAFIAATLGGQVAWGAPQFQGEIPQDVALATLAWTAGVACTGYDGRAHPTVMIVRQRLPDGFLGMATIDDEGLARIELDATHHRLAEVIVHEVAHGWAAKGPSALREGRTELLADCIAQQIPGFVPLQWDDGRTLVALPDLREWRNEYDHGPAMRMDVRTDAYIGAARLFRTAALWVDPRLFWPEDGELGWSRFFEILAESGSETQSLLRELEGGAVSQRVMLGDGDRDGLCDFAERMWDTNPEVWDTDGNGFWDGIEAQSGQIPLPFDETPMCTGYSVGPQGGTIEVVVGGNLRGYPAPNIVISVGRDRARSSRMEFMHPGPVLVRLEEVSSLLTGGVWAEVKGEQLTPSTKCQSDLDKTLWIEAESEMDWPTEFWDMLSAIQMDAQEIWGPSPVRLAVVVGGGRTRMEGPIIRLSFREFMRALRTGDWVSLARRAVAMHYAAHLQEAANPWKMVPVFERYLEDVDSQGQ
jgi:hypothetical protein